MINLSTAIWEAVEKTDVFQFHIEFLRTVGIQSSGEFAKKPRTAWE